MNPFRSPDPLSDRADALLATVWIVACVALSIAFNVLALARVVAAGTF